MSPAPVVLDASAVIAYLLNEPGSQRIQAVLEGGLLSSVNLCEVISKFAERGESSERILSDVLELDLEVVDFTPRHALIAAQLRSHTRSLGLSLGDRACLALGLERSATVLTADRPWAALAGQVLAGLDAAPVIEVLR
ncbi:type II toxin-antitoxin system VapC family toxin [Deinococcus sp.]|uniref:type II toxin-antitoxin system VapC family toxin n=1 Tax=Deinococcus sp. TaxID=47478 RepID=UPI0025E257D9|nr:type II toxin-antitoxin system VapC family toxin [Deinococcus sp.]